MLEQEPILDDDTPKPEAPELDAAAQAAAEEDKAIDFIVRVTKVATGQEVPREQARELFLKAKERMTDAMAQASVEQL